MLKTNDCCGAAPPQVIWGIIREGEPPRQLVEGGEFFVLQKVEKITRVGDLIKA